MLGFSQKSAANFILAILVAVFLTSCAWAQTGNGDRRVGGPCRYISYPGRATIVSIAPASVGSSKSVQGFEVRFSFLPSQKVEEKFARAEGKIFHLYGKNYQYPDRDFINVNRLQVGTVLDGNMQVIISGTCTPVLFEFPGLKYE